ncbi:MAG: hypothetical protein ACR2HD_04465 [Solirubrobacteraceae bacterium]
MLLAAVALVPLWLAAARMRAALLPGARGSLSRLAEIVGTVCLLVWVLELLGAVGLFRTGWVIAGCLVVGVGVALAFRRWSVRRPPTAGMSADDPGVSVAQIGVATTASAIAAGAWGAAIAPAVNGGISDPDTLWYHLPLAIRFVQRHEIVSLNFFGPDSQTSFYPATAELLHGFAILLFGGDVLTPLINVGWLAVALLAAWCLGRLGRRPAACVVAIALLAASLVLRNQAGAADSDVAALALALCAATFVVLWLARSSREGNGALWLAALAAGLAVSAKLTVAAPVAALAIGAVVVARRGVRIAAAATWIAGLAAAGGFWFARNLIAVGNPLPWVSLGPLPATPLLHGEQNFTVVHYLIHGGAGSVFVTGLRHELGPLWPAVLVAALAGAVAAIVRGRSAARLLGIVAVVGALAYVVTPKSAGGPLHHPVTFTTNLRFAGPALALGLLSLALSTPLPAARVARIALAAIGLGLVAVPITYGTIGQHPVGALLGVGAVAVTVAAAWLVRREGRAMRYRLAPAVALLAAFALPVCLAVVALERDGHYADRSNPIRTVWAWASTVYHARIGLAGSFAQSPYYGADLSNHVQYIGQRGPRASFFPEASCQAWRAALNAGRYQYVVISEASRPLPTGLRIPERGWTALDPRATLVLNRDSTFWVYALSGPSDARGCEMLPPGRPGGFVGL